MAFSNYTELQAAIADWIERDDLADRIPDFIKLAEREIYRTLRTPANERTLIFARRVDEGAAINIPEDYLETKLFKVNGCPLYRVSDLQAAQYATPDNGGEPVVFYREANRFVVYPAPADDYEWRLTYYIDMTLSDEAPVNTMLTIAPDLYLFGALAQAEAFMMNDERIPLWKAKFEEAMVELQSIEDRAELSGSPSKMENAYS